MIKIMKEVIFNLSQPQVFLPIIIVLQYISFKFVLKNLSKLDKSVFIFINVVSAAIKFVTLHELMQFVDGIYVTEFFLIYVGLHYIRNILSFCESKLIDCLNISTPLSDVVSIPLFFITLLCYSSLMIVFIVRTFEIIDKKVTFILFTEFICIPISLGSLIYLACFVNKRSKDQQWRKYHHIFLFDTSIMDFIQMIILIIHYSYLCYFTIHRLFFKPIACLLNVGRLTYGMYSKLQGIRDYFVDIYMNESITITTMEEGECAICFKSLKKNCVMFPCKHSFHYNCIKQWLLNHISCPICKESILVDSVDVEAHIKKLPFIYHAQREIDTLKRENNQLREKITEEKGIIEELIKLNKTYTTNNSNDSNMIIDMRNEIEEIKRREKKKEILLQRYRRKEQEQLIKEEIKKNYNYIKKYELKTMYGENTEYYTISKKLLTETERKKQNYQLVLPIVRIRQFDDKLELCKVTIDTKEYNRERNELIIKNTGSDMKYEILNSHSIIVKYHLRVKVDENEHYPEYDNEIFDIFEEFLNKGISIPKQQYAIQIPTKWMYIGGYYQILFNDNHIMIQIPPQCPEKHIIDFDEQTQFILQSTIDESGYYREGDNLILQLQFSRNSIGCIYQPQFLTNDITLPSIQIPQDNQSYDYGEYGFVKSDGSGRGHYIEIIIFEDDQQNNQ